MTLKHLTHKLSQFLVVMFILIAPTQLLANEIKERDDDGAPVPGIEAVLLIEYQSDHVLSGDNNIDGSQTYSTHELDAAIHFSQLLSLYGTLSYQPVRGFLKDFDANLLNDDQFGEDQGIALEELFLELEVQNVSVFGGKFTANFGKAWDETPGVYGTDFAEDYEIIESLGFGAEIEFENTGLGDLTFGVAGFKLDRTGLSRALLQSTEGNRPADGGAGNTSGIESYVVSFDAENIIQNNVLNAHAAYMNRERGVGPNDFEDEEAFVVTLYGAREFYGLNIEWIGEAAFFDNYNATEDDINYYTFGLDFEFYERYKFAISYTHRDVDNPWDGSHEDRLFQTSIGAEVYRGWEADIGYRYTQTTEDEDDAHFLGILISKEIQYKQGAN